MTKKSHPLTDDTIEDIYRSDCGADGMLRAAYDKGDEVRLKQVIEWLEDYEQVCGGFIRIAYFKQAMRPQQQQEDN